MAALVHRLNDSTTCSWHSTCNLLSCPFSVFPFQGKFVLAGVQRFQASCMMYYFAKGKLAFICSNWMFIEFICEEKWIMCSIFPVHSFEINIRAPFVAKWYIQWFRDELKNIHTGGFDQHNTNIYHNLLHFSAIPTNFQCRPMDHIPNSPSIITFVRRGQKWHCNCSG